MPPSPGPSTRSRSTDCTQPVMKRFNIPATARASLSIYNTKEEIDALAKKMGIKSKKLHEQIDQLREAKAVLAALEREHADITSFGSQDVALQTRLLAQQRASVEQGIDARNFILCTDDSHSGTLVNDGHMNRVVRHAIACGLLEHGIAEGDTVAALFATADRHLYRAKADGRGTYRFFEPAMDLEMQAG